MLLDLFSFEPFVTFVFMLFPLKAEEQLFFTVQK